MSRSTRIIQLIEKVASGWEDTVKAMKKHKHITNPYALANWMASQGYASHKGKR